MKKFVASALAAASLIITVVPVAHAATVDSTFAVSVTLASQCKATNSGATTVAFGTYTALQPGALSATPALVTFDCTRGLTPVGFSFDAINGTTTGGGVLAGLNYILSAAAASVGGTPATAAAAANGTADVFTVTVNGTMPALQAGQCGTDGATAAVCSPNTPTTHNRTLTVTY